MTTKTYTNLALYRENPPPHDANRSSRARAEATLEFGRFRLLLRQRRLVADGVSIDLGTRALDLLLVLLEADGSLVTKDELLSRVWPGIVVAEENLKVQISALRRALGEDRSETDHSAVACSTGPASEFSAISANSVAQILSCSITSASIAVFPKSRHRLARLLK
jgi:hypothetical protein